MKPLLHDSILKHVTGESVYVNDIQVNDQLLHGHLVYSKVAHAKFKIGNLDKAKALNGIKAILTYENIPGHNQMGPVVKDEPCLAETEVNFIGQVFLLIAAETKEQARDAEKLIKIEYEPLESIIDLETAILKNNRLHPAQKKECGEVISAFRASNQIIEGTLKTGSQEHWYLETQSCLAVPGEGKEIKLYSSTQHPSETQAIVAEVLGIHKNEVEVEVRRMGGAFGGKETQANHYAVWSALLATATRRPVKIHLTRDEDQIITGKRHNTLSNYKAGFNNEGLILALDVDLNIDAGSSTDLTLAILERALYHVDNAYYIPNLRITGNTWKTNKPSNTAFRGFGGPQGMAIIENIIDRIARKLNKDAAEIRSLNYYMPRKNNITHYGQIVKDNRLARLHKKLVKSSDYFHRREQINLFNSENSFRKKGMAMTPVKFGISFTTSFLNQAGALVNIYKDGTVQVNHGGTEMGQGLHTKIIQVASSCLGIEPEFIKVTATNTSKVPNTSATAASSGSDLNGMAVKNAIEKLKTRFQDVLKDYFSEDDPDSIFEFRNGMVFNPKKPKQKITFTNLVQKAYLDRVSLSATGFYKTPGIFFNSQLGIGNPFHYFAFGMAVSEVDVDVLTGHVKVLRTDILHDAGKSINETIDIGQVEGGFIQGLGWVTTEDLKYDGHGNLLNHSPDTYKIPTIQDIPADFRVELLKNVPNPNTIMQSKAVGEPPFMLAFSVWLAIKDAVSAVCNHQIEPEFAIPATNELILQSIGKINKIMQLQNLKS
jgi:xanthine dehydrogenase large subunit